MINERAKHINVLVFKASPVIKYVKREKEIIPITNPINLPGHNCPS
jgi:hypothetical protein